MMQWNLSYQRQMATDWLVSANYLGNATRHIWGSTDVNYSVSNIIRGNPGGFTKTLDRLVGGLFENDLKIYDRIGRDSTTTVSVKDHIIMLTAPAVSRFWWTTVPPLPRNCLPESYSFKSGGLSWAIAPLAR